MTGDCRLGKDCRCVSEPQLCPNWVTGPTPEAFEFATLIWHSRLGDVMPEKLAPRLDAFAQAAIRRERERCAGIADKFCDIPAVGGRYDNDASRIADRIRSGDVT